MAEEAGTAVAEIASGGESVNGAADSAAVETASPPVVPAPTPPAPAPVAPPRPDPTPRLDPTPRQEPQRSPEPEPVRRPDPLEGAKDANETLLNWRDMVDPEYRKDPVLMQYNSPGEALKGLIHQARLMGSMIPIPKEGASETQMRAVYEKLGCPKTPVDYVIADPPMGQDEDGNAKSLAPNFLVNLLDVCHRAGLNTKQAQEFVNFAARTVVQSENIQAGEMAMQKAQSERALFEAFAGETADLLKKAWMAIGRLGEGRYGGGQYSQRAVEKIRNSSLGNDVDVVAMFANMWDNLGEGNYAEGASGILSSREQIEADRDAFAAIMNDVNKPMDERKAAQARHYKLLQDLNALDDAAARRQNGFR
jgi:hypothetical protein